VRMRFIWENPHSHSLKEIGTIFKVFFKLTKFSGNIFWFKLSQNQLLLDNCDLAKIAATVHRTHKRMFSSWTVRELPDYRSDPPQVIYKERRGDFLIPDMSFTETFLLEKICFSFFPQFP
jgi:hypothetical protein